MTIKTVKEFMKKIICLDGTTVVIRKQPEQYRYVYPQYNYKDDTETWINIRSKRITDIIIERFGHYDIIDFQFVNDLIIIYI